MYPRWRIIRIETELEWLYGKYGEYLGIELMTGPLLKICHYHIEGNSLEEKAEIKESQEKCAEYPKPNFFLDGYCYHYRPPTGHCDLFKRENNK